MPRDVQKLSQVVQDEVLQWLPLSPRYLQTAALRCARFRARPHLQISMRCAHFILHPDVAAVEKDFIAQSGDPTGTGRGGMSINGILFGDQARFIDDELRPELRHAKKGTLSMASLGHKNSNGSQFFLTLRDNIDYLDGKHTVFGTIGEGLDVLEKINEAICDEEHRPLRNIRIRHTIVLVCVSRT
jgi:cyclophilin family peptidyl-prolyl cis-trans isomerase